MSSLGAKLVVVDAALEAAGIPHAFGGAIALAYCTRHPRATSDLDINIFLDPDDAGRALAALPRQVTVTASNRKRITADGQDRLWWDDTPVDVFLNTHPFHSGAAGRIRWEAFEGRRIPLLSCQDLAVFKAMFNRLKDWADIEEMVAADVLEPRALRRQLVELLDEPDERLSRLAEITNR